MDGSFALQTENGPTVEVSKQAGGKAELEFTDTKIINHKSVFKGKVAGLDTTLRRQGFFEKTGAFTYHFEKGEVKGKTSARMNAILGAEDDDRITGSFHIFGGARFELTVDGSLDTTRKIELLKYAEQHFNPAFHNNGKGLVRGSFISITDTELGTMYSGTGQGDKPVIACFRCNDFSPSQFDARKFSGYFFTRGTLTDSCSVASCETAQKATMRGYVSGGFTNSKGQIDAFHEGFDQNLVVSYYPNGKDATGVDTAIFELESCTACVAGSIVAAQTLNNKFFRVENSEVGDSGFMKLRYKKVDTVPASFISKLHDAKFGNTRFDRDLYYTETTSKLNDGLFNTGVYVSDAINQGRGLSGSPFDSRNTFEQTTPERNFFVVNKKSWNFDSKDNQVAVEDLYVIPARGHVVLEQKKLTDTGVYSAFFLRQATSEIFKLLGDLKGSARQLLWANLQKAKAQEVYIKNRLQKVSAIIDLEESKSIFRSGAALDLLGFSSDLSEAREFLDIYGKRYQGAQVIFDKQVAGKNLEQIFKEAAASASSENSFENAQANAVLAAFREPLVAHNLNTERVSTAFNKNLDEVAVYNPVSGTESLLDLRGKTKTDVDRILTHTTIFRYFEDGEIHKADREVALSLWGKQLNSELSGSSEQIAFGKFFTDIKNGNYGALSDNQLGAFFDGTLTLDRGFHILQDLGMSEKHLPEGGGWITNSDGGNIAYVLEGGQFLITDPVVLQMLASEKIHEDDLTQLFSLAAERNVYETFTDLHELANALLVPENEGDLALSLATGGLGKPLTAFKLALANKGLLGITKAAGALSGNAALAVFGIGAVGAKSLDDVVAVHHKFAKDRTVTWDMGTIEDEYNHLQKLYSIDPEHVVRPFGYIYDENGRIIGYSMEKIDGQDLRDYVRENGYSDDLESKIRSVFEGMWEKGGFHGDLHERNIMVTREGDIKIIDPAGFRKASLKYLTKRKDEANLDKAFDALKTVASKRTVQNLIKEAEANGVDLLDHANILRLEEGYDPSKIVFDINSPTKLSFDGKPWDPDMVIRRSGETLDLNPAVTGVGDLDDVNRFTKYAVDTRPKFYLDDELTIEDEFNHLRRLYENSPQSFARPIGLKYDEAGNVVSYQTEKILGQDLLDYIRDNGLPESLKVKIRSTYMEIWKKGEAHGDVHATNIVITRKGDVKLINPLGYTDDSGLAKKIALDGDRLSRIFRDLEKEAIHLMIVKLINKAKKNGVELRDHSNLDHLHDISFQPHGVVFDINSPTRLSLNGQPWDPENVQALPSGQAFDLNPSANALD